MTIEVTPPAPAGPKHLLTGLAGASMGLAAFGASGAIVSFTPSGGSITATGQDDYIDFDLTDLGAISATVGSDSTPVSDHLYLIVEFLSSIPGAALNVENNDNRLAKSGSAKVRIFEQDELIDASAFNSVADGDFDAGLILSETPGFLGFQLSPTGGPAQYGWVQFSKGSISSTGLAINTTSGQGICAGSGVSCVPLPPTLALLAAGVAGLGAVRRRKLDA